MEQIYLNGLKKMIEECFFMYPEQAIFNAWNIDSRENFFINKAPILLKKLIEQKIPAKYFDNCEKILYEKYPKFPPNLGEVIVMLKPKLNYESLFEKTRKDIIQINRFLDSIDDSIKRENLSIFSYNVYLKMNSQKGINIITQKWCDKIGGLADKGFGDCKDAFIEVYDMVDFMQPNEFEPIPEPIVKLQQAPCPQEQIKLKKMQRESWGKIRELLAINTISN